MTEPMLPPQFESLEPFAAAGWCLEPWLLRTKPIEVRRRNRQVQIFGVANQLVSVRRWQIHMDALGVTLRDCRGAGCTEDEAGQSGSSGD